MAGPDRTRRVEVTPERLAGWVERFSARHGATSVHAGANHVRLRAADDAVAWIEVPWPPWRSGNDPVAGLVVHASRPLLLGIVLVRRRGHAVGVLDGSRLADSAVGSRHVQGKTKAGGWSQQRYARRRDAQARAAFAAAADAAVKVLGPRLGRLDGVVPGGDRRAVDEVLADPRLRGLAELPRGRFLAVPDPRKRVLQDAAVRARSVLIEVTDPPAHRR
ncbi:MAG: hypothetical protein GEU93_07375 [Propionibacteriales bacterium]|nr:hypothetical protein [Propionibacteriales bacterium]